MITVHLWNINQGVGSLPYFSDDEEDSGDSSSQDDKSDGGESDDNDGDVGGLLDEQLERRTSSGCSDDLICLNFFLSIDNLEFTN